VEIYEALAKDMDLRAGNVVELGSAIHVCVDRAGSSADTNADDVLDI